MDGRTYLREDECFVKRILSGDVLKLLDKSLQLGASLEVDLLKGFIGLSQFQITSGILPSFTQIFGLEGLLAVGAFGHPPCVLLFLDISRSTITATMILVSVKRIATGWLSVLTWLTRYDSKAR